MRGNGTEEGRILKENRKFWLRKVDIIAPAFRAKLQFQHGLQGTDRPAERTLRRFVSAGTEKVTANEGMASQELDR